MFAVQLANFLMLTVSGENTIKCLEGLRKKKKKETFFLHCYFLSALRKSVHEL